MSRPGLAVWIVVLAAAGCVRTTKTQPQQFADDLMTKKPTEEEVRHRVWSRVTPRTVTLLSPLLPVPDLYFAKTNNAVDPAAVACYVSFRTEQATTTEDPGQVTVELVVIGRDAGRFNAKERGNIFEYPVIGAEHLARDYFGNDWLAQHPWPKDARAK